MEQKDNPKKSIGKKGFAMVLDALVALIVLVSVITLINSMEQPVSNSLSETSFKKIHYITEDSLDVLNKQGILDEIGAEWAGANGSTNSTSWLNATNITKGYLDKLIPGQFGYKLLIDEVNVIYDSSTDNSSNRPKESENTTTKTHSSRLLVGYGKGLPVLGQVARAFLTSIKEKETNEYAYFGGFEGQGKLTKIVHLPASLDTAKEICFEYDAGDDFDLRINGNLVAGGALNKSTGSMSSQTVCYSDAATTGLIIPGDNEFNISFIGGDIKYYYIAGGYIKVTYNTSQLDTSPYTGSMKYDFPGIYGLINLYSSFYVPGTLNSMNAHLKFDNNYSTYLTVGNARIFDTNYNTSRDFCIISGDSYTCDIPNANLSQLLIAGGFTYSDLSEKTIPLRMGTANLTGVTGMIGTADVILITDLSGSMDARIGYNDMTSGVVRNCDDPNIYDNDTSRISLAKCLDKDFVNSILNNTENRVGLVGFNTDAYTSEALTNNNVTLINEIDTYSANSGTCICCAINKAIELLNDSIQIIPQGADWRYRAYTTCANSCNPTTAPSSCTPSGWQNISFNDGAWGWSDYDLPQTQTTWTNRVHYYRKHFTLSSPLVGDGTLFIRNRRGVECYLNENLIGSDTSCSTGNLWDNSWTIPNAYFNPVGVDNVLACRVRCGGFPNTRGIEFDAKLIGIKNSSNNKYIIVMTDGIAGYHCGGCGNIPTCSGSCTSTSGTQAWGCGGTPPGDCNNNACDPAINDAVCASKRAFTSNGINVYSVGFGPVADCYNSNQTLQLIADYGNATYYASSNATELGVIYDHIADSILNSTFKSQYIEIEGGMVNSTLYPESYIEFLYTAPENYAAYGDVTFTQNTPKFNDTATCTGSIFVPSTAKIVDARVTSYSAEHWTDYVRTNTTTIYALRDGIDFGDDYTVVGDPYIIPIPPAYMQSGVNNTLTVDTGDVPTPLWVSTGCSPDNSAIYTIRLNERVNYGNVFPYKAGCTWTIQFEDDTNITEPIPTDYVGSAVCIFSNTNVTYNPEDAIDDAIFRLLQGLDSNGNNKVDVKFDTSMVQFDYSQSGGVKSLWGPITVKLVIWM